MRKKACVAMGGGPTRVINRTLWGIVSEAEKHSIEVVAARHGIEGVLGNAFVELESGSAQVTAARCLPGAFIGTTRKKPTEEDCEAAFEVFKKNDIHYFFYIGGNDTSESSAIINRQANAAGYELRTFHVPKTIDNDLAENDHTPGYGSAARFVAHAVLGDDLEVRSLPGVKIDIAMGRDTGWLAAAAALCKAGPDDGPHLIYFPERPKSVRTVLEDIVGVYQRLKRAVVVVSEGLQGPSGAPFVLCDEVHRELSEDPFRPLLAVLDALKGIEAATGGAKTDSFGHVQLSGTGVLADMICSALKLHCHAEGIKLTRVRADTFGYMQRAYAGDVSPVDAEEAEMVGAAAMGHAAGADIDGSIALQADRADGRYVARTALLQLDAVAGKVRRVPDAFINEKGNGVTPAYVEYARPLVGPLARG